jgi:hypothetical protein
MAVTYFVRMVAEPGQADWGPGIPLVGTRRRFIHLRIPTVSWKDRRSTR